MPDDPTPIPAADAYGFIIAPKPTGVLEFPALPPPPVLVEALPILVLALSVAYIIQGPPRVKRDPIHDEREANKKVLKLSEAYKAIDKILHNKVIYLRMITNIFKAIYHTATQHFPRWLDAVSGAADFQDEVMEPISVALKNELWNHTLDQTNPRRNGQWQPRKGAQDETSIDFGGGAQAGSFSFPIPLKIRKGKLHGLNPPRNIVLPA